MTEKEYEVANIQYGTVKKKADLLRRTPILTPQKLRHAIKSFGEPIPVSLLEAEEYAIDFCDYLLDEQGEYYDQFNEGILRETLIGYIKHEVWIIKQKTRSIVDPRCSVAMDIRKSLKDSISAFAQIAGRTVKNCADGLPVPTQKELRITMIEAAEASIEKTHGDQMIAIGLLEG